MIFGYNSEVREGDTVYHVQSEARVCNLTLETLVFVKGRCVSKRLSPYDASRQDAEAQELLRLQHRAIMQSIQSRQLDKLEAQDAPPDPVLTFAHACREAGELVLRFQINRSGVPAPNLKLRCCWAEPGSELAPELISELVSDHDGVAELRLRGEPPSGVELLVELEIEGRTKLRRFRLQRARMP